MNVLDGNVLILASAGSGKTYQLGNRVIGRVARGVDPERIVALTFTRKAAGEFADSVLGKLAEAVLDGAKAAELERAIAGEGDAAVKQAMDFEPVLRRIVVALPVFTLTTIDSFFTRVVRGFQYELGVTGGRFDLLEGARAASARDGLLAGMLGRELDEGGGDAFVRAFRRATVAREDVRVAEDLRGFLADWHREYRRDADGSWGPDFLLAECGADWREELRVLALRAREACEVVEESRKGQINSLHGIIGKFEGYEPGGGGLSGGGKLFDDLLDAVAERAAGDIELAHYKPFVLPAAAFEAITLLVRRVAAVEMNAAVARTRAVREVVGRYDALAADRLRRRGLLGFDDVKVLMGEWSRSEDARLRRELVDFRLDARYEQWLLDEFQDTSREEWTGLLPLLDEAVADGTGGLFIVGDRKQAIYGWRGGDVSLFDEVDRRFGRGMRTLPMAVSWRSCPEVLGLVNQVCGDAALIGDMFGIGPERWVWDVHESAPPLRRADRAGEACVEILEDTEEPGPHGGGGDAEDGEGEGTADPRISRMIERMRELGIGRKILSCGVLVRRNSDGRMVADALREAGFDVVQDGVRTPAKDHPACVAVWHLLRWMADPADDHARGVVAMSPLAGLLRPDAETPWHEVWDGLGREVCACGFAPLVTRLVRPLLEKTSANGRRRLAEVVDALAAFDAGVESGARAAADWLERWEVPESPGAAAVQVMTIHKSKGLGFDVVFLPLVPDRRVPEASRFKVARGEGWLCAAPPSWVCRISPEMRTARVQWEAAERYESLCLLYVALTRAKRGLYVYLIKKGKKPTLAAPTHTNWILRAIDADCGPGTKWRTGNPDWAAAVAGPAASAPAPASTPPGTAVPRRRRVKPSAHDEVAPLETGGHPPANAAGLRFGSEVHACFERIGWIDDPNAAALPPTPAGRAVAGALAGTDVAAVFRKPPGCVALLREQAVDAIADGGGWLTGVIDRMHIHRDTPDGPVTRVDVIDFKTDAVDGPAVLLARHTPQMRAYGDAVRRLFPEADIRLTLVSTSLKQTVAVPLA